MATLALRLVGGSDLESDDELDDARLLVSAGNGSEQAFAMLVRRHYPVVYRVVWRMMSGHSDAQDVTQEAFMRLWKNPGQLREAKALRGWLIRVANNLVLDRLRKKPMLDLEAVGEIADGRAGNDSALEKTAVSARMDAAMAKLPERQRLALTLVQFEQFSNIKAAEVMEVSVEALESLLARAKRALKQDLSGEWRDMLSAIADG